MLLSIGFENGMRLRFLMFDGHSGLPLVDANRKPDCRFPMDHTTSVQVLPDDETAIIHLFPDWESRA